MPKSGNHTKTSIKGLQKACEKSPIMFENTKWVECNLGNPLIPASYDITTILNLFPKGDKDTEVVRIKINNTNIESSETQLTALTFPVIVETSIQRYANQKDQG